MSSPAGVAEICYGDVEVLGHLRLHLVDDLFEHLRVEGLPVGRQRLPLADSFASFKRLRL